MSGTVKRMALLNESNGVFQIVTGKNESEEHIFSVVVKRTYRFNAGAGALQRCEFDNPLRGVDVYYDKGDPSWSTLKHEQELVAYKPSVDVVVIGKAHAPNGVPVETMDVAVHVGERSKELVIFGNRECSYREHADPLFTDPRPFLDMEIRYDYAYGGQDEISDPNIPFHYPRNNMGKGVVLQNQKQVVDGLALPNIEDPKDLLLPERVIIGDPGRWHEQPLPQGLGWRQHGWYPRSALFGAYPAFTEVGTVTTEERMGLLPQNHIALAKQSRLPTFEAYFNNGASLGLIFQNLKGDEAVALKGLSTNGLIEFFLPGETPEILLDIGRGERQLDSRLQTVSIRPDDGEVDLIWSGTEVYEGYSWWPKMRRLHAQVS
jgi:hypothetical protein